MSKRLKARVQAGGTLVLGARGLSLYVDVDGGGGGGGGGGDGM